MISPVIFPAIAVEKIIASAISHLFMIETRNSSISMIIPNTQNNIPGSKKYFPVVQPQALRYRFIFSLYAAFSQAGKKTSSIFRYILLSREEDNSFSCAILFMVYSFVSIIVID